MRLYLIYYTIALWAIHSLIGITVTLIGAWVRAQPSLTFSVVRPQFGPTAAGPYITVHRQIGAQRFCKT
jgi:hypothetical protein